MIGSTKFHLIFYKVLQNIIYIQSIIGCGLKLRLKSAPKESLGIVRS